MGDYEQVRVSREMADRLRVFHKALNDGMPNGVEVSLVDASRILSKMWGSNGVVVLTSNSKKRKILDAESINILQDGLL